MDPLRYEIEIVSIDEIFSRPTETYGSCSSTHALPYAASLALLNLGSLGFAVYEAFRSNGFSTEYDESEYIFKAMIGILLACFVGIPVIAISQDSPQAYSYVVAAMIFLTCSLVLLLIFVPKMRALNKPKPTNMTWDVTQQFSSASSLGGGATRGMGSAATQQPAARLGVRVSVHPKKAAEDMEIFNKLLREEIKDLETENLQLTEYVKSIKVKYSIPSSNTESQDGDVDSHEVVANNEDGNEVVSATEPANVKPNNANDRHRSKSVSFNKTQLMQSKVLKRELMKSFSQKYPMNRFSWDDSSRGSFDETAEEVIPQQPTTTTVTATVTATATAAAAQSPASVAGPILPLSSSPQTAAAASVRSPSQSNDSVVSMPDTSDDELIIDYSDDEVGS